MPYSADLRCSYIHLSINKDWVFQLFLDENKRLEFDEEYDELGFWNELEKALARYTEKKLFWPGSQKGLPDTAWEVIQEFVENVVAAEKGVRLVEDDEEEQSDEE